MAILPILSKVKYSRKDLDGRTGHNDPIEVVPFDLKGSAGEMDRHVSVGSSAQTRGNCRGTGTRATGQGLAGASLPYTHS